MKDNRTHPIPAALDPARLENRRQATTHPGWGFAKLRLTDGKWFVARALELHSGGFTCEQAWGLAKMNDPHFRDCNRRWFPSRLVREVYEVEEPTGDAR